LKIVYIRKGRVYMGKVILDISISLDGFIAGPGDNQKLPLGIGGDAIQSWLFEGNLSSFYNDFFKLTEINKKVFDGMIRETGAMVVGRNTFNNVNGWEGSHPIEGLPIFVVTHKKPRSFTNGKSTFTFVTEGVDSAIQQAKKAAAGKNVSIGTASIAQQCINLQLMDELNLHVAPVLLRSGSRLFEGLEKDNIKLKSKQVIDGKSVTHLKYEISYE